MKSKIEDGKLLIEWYKNGEETIFIEFDNGDYVVPSLIEIIDRLQSRVSELERRMSCGETSKP